MKTLKDCNSKQEITDALIEWIQSANEDTGEVIKNWKRFNVINDMPKTIVSIKAFIKYFGNLKEKNGR